MEHYPRFGGQEAASQDRSGSGTAVLPVPYDRTSTWIKGADKGPFAVLEASANLEFYDIETDSEAWKNGIYTCPPVETEAGPEEMAVEVEKRVRELLDEDKLVVTLGGEHSVSIGAVRAYAGKFKDLSVLQLDAHADLRDEYEGSRYNHACVMARVKEICPAVQAGIRSMSAEEKAPLDAERTFFAKDIVSDSGYIEKAVSLLTDDVYVTIDLDVFDPAVMPSTGTPEPGGLDWYGVLRLLKAVTEKKNVRGFDVVELCPRPDNRAPDFLAAKLVYKMLSYI